MNSLRRQSNAYRQISRPTTKNRPSPQSTLSKPASTGLKGLPELPPPPPNAPNAPTQNVQKMLGSIPTLPPSLGQRKGSKAFRPAKLSTQERRQARQLAQKNLGAVLENHGLAGKQKTEAETMFAELMKLLG